MNVRDIMTKNPACCSLNTPIQEVAQMMVDCNCGEIPVVDDTGILVGVVTDRDITCRAVAKGRNPLDLTAHDCMSSPVVTVRPDSSVDECCDCMEVNQVRRVPVVDSNGHCCGIVSQADIARHAAERQAASVVRDVSRPTASASSVKMH